MAHASALGRISKAVRRVYAASILIWLLASKGLVDPGGHPIGADFIDPT